MRSITIAFALAAVVGACSSTPNPAAPTNSASPTLGSAAEPDPVAISNTVSSANTVSGSSRAVVTDANGRYQFQSTQNSLIVASLVPPTGYEGAYTGLGTITPGEHDFIARHIIRFTIRPPGTVAVSDGTNWHGVSSTAEFGTGVAEE